MSNQNKYSYKGMSLLDFCKSNPELNYNSLRKYVYRQTQKNSNQTVEQIIDQYMNKLHKGIYRYYYIGIPLKQYCQENHLNYTNILAYIQYHKKDDQYIGLNDDEFIELIMGQYEPFEAKYVYNGLVLTDYCKQNNIPYTSVISFVNRKLALGVEKPIDDLVKEGIETINRYGVIYYYQGLLLVDYCKKNNINYSTIRGTILKRKMNNSKPLQEIVNKCVADYQKLTIKYLYEGITLRQYCIHKGISYKAILNKYLDEYQNYSNVDEALKEIISEYLNHPPKKTKYYFKDKSLANFCKEKNYSYANILRRLYRLKLHLNVDDNQIIETVIQKYEYDFQIHQISAIFKRIETEEIQNLNEQKELCNFLKIDFSNVTDLIDMDFSFSQAISLIWYFSDIHQDYKILSDKKLDHLFSLVKDLKENPNLDNISLYDLIGIYKCKLYDTRNEIIIKQKKYIMHTIYSLCQIYEVSLNKDNLADFESELNLALIAVINRICLNTAGQMIKYMDLSIKGYFRTFLKQYKQENYLISLDEPYGKNNSEHQKTRLDVIADTSRPYEEIDNNSFSSDMMEALKSLPLEDLSFILLKYQENYSDEELADHFNLSTYEICQKEREIFSMLQNNDYIKALKK